MNWEPNAKSLYKAIIKNIPLPVKLIAAPAIGLAAEKNGVANGRTVVTQPDLIDGIFDVVPQSYRARTVANLTLLGIDCEKYLTACERQSAEHTELGQLWSTLSLLGKISGVPVDEAKTKAVLEAYRSFFKSSPLSIRITTDPQESRDLSVLYLETIKAHTPDPLTMAVHKGFVVDDRSRPFLLFEETKRKFDVLGYGVDLSVSRGVSRLRIALMPTPIETLLELKHLPPGVKKCLPLMKKHGLTRCSMLDFDFVHKTIGLNVMIREPSRALADAYNGLLADLNFNGVEPQIFAQCALASVVQYIFSWRSDTVERICFATLYQDKKDVPVHFHPLIKSCVETPAFSNGHQKFILGTVISPAQHWFNIESDHNGRMIDAILIASQAGV